MGLGEYETTTLEQRGKPAITTEVGYLGVPDEEMIERNFRSVLRLMRHLEMLPGLGIRRSLRASQLPPASQEYLAPRQRVSYFFDHVEPPSQDQTLDG